MKSIASRRKKCAGAAAVIAAGVEGIGAGVAGTGAGAAAGVADIGAGIAAVAGGAATGVVVTGETLPLIVQKEKSPA
jgi:hypothetical protein